MNQLITISAADAFKSLVTTEGMDLKTLQNTYAEIPDVETKEGYALIAAGLTEALSLKKIVAEKKADIKAPALKYCSDVESEFKRITAILVDMIEPRREAKRLVDNRKKKQKEELEVKLLADIDKIKDAVKSAIDQSSTNIQELINSVGETDTDHGFYHRAGDAALARAETLRTLEDMLRAAIESEQAQERLRELEAAEAERLANQVNDDHETGLMMNKLFDIDREAEQKALAEQERLDAIEEEKRLIQVEKDRVENEKRIADEAVKQAKIDADNLAEENRKEALRLAEKAEADQIKAVKDAEAEVLRKAKAAEDKRLESENLAKIVADKKSANKAHRKNIDHIIVKALHDQLRISEQDAKGIITKILTGDIPNLRIDY